MAKINSTNNFKQDEEIKNRYAAEQAGESLHDDEVTQDDDIREKHHIRSKIKVKPDLVEKNIVLSVRNLKQHFNLGSGSKKFKLKAVSNVSFDIEKGECFGLVGESGCGKTTTGRSIIKLYDITSGSIYYKGYRISAGNRWNLKEIKFTKKRQRISIRNLTKERDAKLAELDKNAENYQLLAAPIHNEYQSAVAEVKRNSDSIIGEQKAKLGRIKYDNAHYSKSLINEIQMIFQDPVDSLDPRMTVEDIIQEGLKIKGQRNKMANHKKVIEMLEKVGLNADHASRYPHEFSGGQRQRIGIARALVMNPELLICDEPISALDVSIRAQIINLLNDLKQEYGLTILFIAHDLSVVKYFCDRIAVMYAGKIVETASSDELFTHPLHPYTKSLLSAIPKPDPIFEKKRKRILYVPQEAHNYTEDFPTMREVSKDHFVYCNEVEFINYQKELKIK